MVRTFERVVSKNGQNFKILHKNANTHKISIWHLFNHKNKNIVFIYTCIY